MESMITVAIFYVCIVGVANGIPLGSAANETEPTVSNESRTMMLEQQVIELTASVQSLKDVIVLNDQNFAMINKRLAVLENMTYSNVEKDTRTVFSDIIGFTATIQTDIDDLPVGSTVLFKEVLYNAGSGYDKSTGIFTCPRSGLYMFAIFVEAVNGKKEASIAIKLNGSWRVSAISERFEDGHDSTGGNMMVEHLQAGDRVWVETYNLDNQDLFNSFTSFSGVLIKST